MAAGLALTAKRLDRVPSRVWVLCGDSELAEGSIWEAFDHASFWELDNLIAIVDVNRLGQTGETMHGWDLDLYAERARSFGWEAIVVDGHDVAAVEQAYAARGGDRRPPDRSAGPHPQGRRRRGRGRSTRQARQAARRARAGDRRAGRRARPPGPPDRARRRRPAPLRAARRRACRPTRRATRWPRARPTARRSSGSGTPAATWSPSTARSPTRPTARSSATRIPSATSRCTSPSSSWSPPPWRCSGAAGARSHPRSRRSSRARTTSCAWPP